MNENTRPAPHDLMDSMLQLRNEVFKDGRQIYERWEPGIKVESFEGSAKNLAYYLALRRRDIRELQEELSNWGLSSLGRLESRTLSSIDAVIVCLAALCDRKDEIIKYPKAKSFRLGKRQLHTNAENLFGKRPEHRYSSIMQTLSVEGAEDSKLVKNLLNSGCNIIRINCAHDDPEVWGAIIKNVRKIAAELGVDCRIHMDIAGPKARTDWVLSSQRNDKLMVGDKIYLTHSQVAKNNPEFKVQMACSLPGLLEDVEIGEPILLDDGVVEGEVLAKDKEGVIIEIKKTDKVSGVRIKADKGLNFPKTQLNLPVITEKDEKDLDFVVHNSDIIGFSFIKNVEDMKRCYDEIDKRLEPGERYPGVIAKIETMQGVNNLPDIIAYAAGRSDFGVMVARGDLAIETGYIRLAELQQQILWICEAADVPTIWATEVLDNMVTSGIPTRAEVTDAAEGGARSECVMLNRGSYAADAVSFLAELLERMEQNIHKKSPLLRALNIAKQVELDDESED